MWKDKGLQLVMLPTNKKAIFYLEDGEILTKNRVDNSTLKHNLYLLSDEEIKEGDILFTDENSIVKASGLYGDYPYDLINEIGGQMKIIASTDPSLNLPQFPSSFLKEYVNKCNSKKSLEVEVDCNGVVWQQSSDRYNDNDVYCNGEKVASFDYELQEEEMNRFTERLSKQPKVNPDNTISIRFKEEKMYSRSEVEELCRNAFKAGEAYRTGEHIYFKQIHPNENAWIKENLK